MKGILYFADDIFLNIDLDIVSKKFENNKITENTRKLAKSIASINVPKYSLKEELNYILDNYILVNSYDNVSEIKNIFHLIIHSI